MKKKVTVTCGVESSNSEEVAAESNQNLTGSIDGVDNMFSENFDFCFLRQIN